MLAAILSPDFPGSSTERLVALAIAAAGDVCFASTATLAERTGLSRRTIQTARSSLLASGVLLEVESPVPTATRAIAVQHPDRWGGAAAARGGAAAAPYSQSQEGSLTIGDPPTLEGSPSVGSTTDVGRTRDPSPTLTVLAGGRTTEITMNQLPLLGVATDPPSRARPGVAAAADAIVARWADLAASRRTRGLPAPPEPRFADPRRVVGRDAVERAVARYGMADVLLVVEWAFQAPGYHPRLLRGEEGDGTIYLGLANLLRITKIPEKLDKAQQWDAAGREIEETSRAGYYEGAGDLAAKLEMEAWPEDCPFHAARGAK